MPQRITHAVPPCQIVPHLLALVCVPAAMNDAEARALLLGKKVVRNFDPEQRLGWHTGLVGLLNGFELRCNTRGEEDDMLNKLRANQQAYQRSLKKKMEQKSRELQLAKEKSRKAKEERDKELKEDQAFQARSRHFDRRMLLASSIFLSLSHTSFCMSRPSFDRTRAGSTSE